MGKIKSRRLGVFSAKGIFVFLLLKILTIEPLNGAIESKRLLSFHFDKIEARGALSIFIKPGKRNREIEYYADSSIIESVTCRVSNRTLFLDANNSLSLSRRIPLLRLTAQRTFPIEVFISIDELKQISLLENCLLSMENLSAEELNLFIGSSGSLHASNLKIKQINIRHEGSGDIFLKGRDVISLNAEIYGSGSLRCEELFLDKATVRHYGSGRAILAPTIWLDGQIFGTGNLELLENPEGKVIRNSGSGGRLIELY